MKAYAELIKLHCVVVPKLLFVSRSWCGKVRLMGLELGRRVKGDEPD